MKIKSSKIILPALMLLSFFTTRLQGQEVYEITAAQAVDLAFKNAADLKNARLDYKIAEARNKEITGMANPQVSGSLTGNHYLTLPQIQFPDGSEKSIYDVLRAEGVKDGNGNTIMKEGEFKVVFN